MEPHTESILNGWGRNPPSFITKGQGHHGVARSIRSLNRWSNFVLAFALVLITLIPSVSHAGIYYEESNRQYSSAQESCDYFASIDPSNRRSATAILVDGYTDRYTCHYYDKWGGSRTSTTIYERDFDCPASLPYEHSDGICYSEEEAPQCPVGQVDLGGGDCQAICNAGTARTLFIPVYSATNNIITETGCTAQFNKTDTNSCKSYQDTIYCVAEYIETDQFNETNPCDSYTPTGIQGGCYTTIGGTDDTNPTGTINDTEGTEDLPKPTSTEQTSSTEPVTETHPDGSTTTTSSETTTKTLDSGTTIEQIGSTVVKKDSSGNIIEIVEQTTFNTYTDGTATETIEETTTATPSTVTKTTRDFTNNTTTTTTTQTGQSGSQTVTVTKNYNSSGHVTSSETTTTGTVTDTGTGDSGSGDGEGEGTPAFCEYAETVCDFIDWFKGDGTEAPAHPDLPVEQIDLSEQEVEWSSGLGSGTCPAPLVMGTMGGKSVVIDYSEQCSAISGVLKPIMLFVATLISGYILSGLRRQS